MNMQTSAYTLHKILTVVTYLWRQIISFLFNKTKFSYRHQLLMPTWWRKIRLLMFWCWLFFAAKWSPCPHPRPNETRIRGSFSIEFSTYCSEADGGPEAVDWTCFYYYWKLYFLSLSGLPPSPSPHLSEIATKKREIKSSLKHLSIIRASVLFQT